MCSVGGGQARKAGEILIAEAGGDFAT